MRATAEKYGLGPATASASPRAAASCPSRLSGSYELGERRRRRDGRRVGAARRTSSVVRPRGRGDHDRRGRGRRACHPSELVRRIEAVVPRSASRCGPASQAAKETAADINDQIGGFLTPALLAFAGAALLVGAFIIFNTFTITVAERTREFALLRTLGATRAADPRRRGARGARDRRHRVGRRALASGSLFAKALGALFEAVGLGIPTGGSSSRRARSRSRCSSASA